MNGPPAQPVGATIPHPREAKRLLWAAIGAGMCAVSTACIQIDGGAVELSWTLRSFEGESVAACQNARIQDIRLCWEPLGADGSTAGEACRATQLRAFPCEETSGVTGFDLTPGSTAFWVQPVCTDGDPADAATYQVPPPIVRTVEEGKIVSLNSLLLVVTPMGDECPATGCTCERP